MAATTRCSFTRVEDVLDEISARAGDEGRGPDLRWMRQPRALTTVDGMIFRELVAYADLVERLPPAARPWAALRTRLRIRVIERRLVSGGQYEDDGGPTCREVH